MSKYTVNFTIYFENNQIQSSFSTDEISIVNETINGLVSLITTTHVKRLPTEEELKKKFLKEEKIQAIKYIREMTGMSLKGARDYMLSLEYFK